MSIVVAGFDAFHCKSGIEPGSDKFQLDVARGDVVQPESTGAVNRARDASPDHRYCDGLGRHRAASDDDASEGWTPLTLPVIVAPAVPLEPPRPLPDGEVGEKALWLQAVDSSASPTHTNTTASRL